MKNTIYIFIVVCFFFSTFIQSQEIPNAGFENWSGNNPVDWLVVNNQLYNNVTPSSTAHSGSSSLRAEIIEYSFPPAPSVPAIPLIFVGNTPGATIPVSQNYSSMSGFYQYYPTNTGLNLGPSFLVTLYDNENNTVAQGEVDLVSETISSWQSFAVPLDYSDGSGNPATKASITISIKLETSDFGSVYGTYFLVDDLAFEGTTGITKEDNNIPAGFSLEQNYPNPFNPATNINFNLPEESLVNLKVFNIQGEEVATLVNEKLSAGTYKTDWNASEMTSGVYIYVLKTKNIILSRKMILMK